MYNKLMPSHWYAIQSHSRKEDLLWHQLQVQDIECFYPRIQVKPVNPRSRKVVPYFPGYLFVRIDIQEQGISRFQWLPYATGIVSFGGEPAMVPDTLVEAIRSKTTTDGKIIAPILEDIKHGDRVIIDQGPFAGYEAIFDTRLPGNERVRVLMKMLNDRNVPVELRSEQVHIKKQSNPPNK